MCKNYLILYIFLLTMVNLHTANAHHELEDQNILNGEENYQAHCASCHGVDLEGQPNWRTMKADGSLPAPPHDETGHTWHHDTKMLFDYTKYGGQKTLSAVGITDYKSGMPGYEDVLSDLQIWEILAFIRSTWPKEIQDLHATRH